MTDPADQPAAPGRGRSLRGFYIAMGVLAVLVGLGVVLAPAGQLRYHAWKHRTARDPAGESLRWLAEYSARRHLDRAEVKHLLGEPLEERTEYLLYRLNPCPLDSAPLIGYFILFKDGRVTEVQPWAGVGIR